MRYKIQDTTVEIDNYNNDFLLLRTGEQATIKKIGKAIYQQQFDFVDEVIVTEVEVCLKLNTHFKKQKLEALKTISLPDRSEAITYRLPVYFHNHEDWQTIEKATKLSKQMIIKELSAIKFSIAMFAFLPGFIYFNGLPKALQIPRKTTPSKYVKANSIAIGGKYLGLYSLDSPGGWHVLGLTPTPVLQVPSLPPVLINIDDYVQLEPIDEPMYRQLLSKKITIQAYNA